MQRQSVRPRGLGRPVADPIPDDSLERGLKYIPMANLFPKIFNSDRDGPSGTGGVCRLGNRLTCMCRHSDSGTVRSHALTQVKRVNAR
jgi:hypothetical protein